MTHFLYKPHVVGPENNITTPDVVIDRVSVLAGSEHYHIPVQRLLSGVELQVYEGGLSVTPAYALVACGGGDLVSICALIRSAGHPPTTADLLVTRSAWRLRNVADHFGSLELATAGAGSLALSELAGPADIIGRVSANSDALPRGIMVLCAAPKLAVSITAPESVTVELDDRKLDRSLSQCTALIPVDFDRWEERPLPRYTVGPVGEVEHFI